ncbi:Purine catabolism regulatory protein-like familyprotein [Pseudomonas putida]|uniref:Purine catabolism regulatory protein-like familyprotein n=1 Tax=Pseudomonas putida TaxID=303 RepID=A0A1B2F2W3_PSEPU|nr:Purine catabolism regulatory protein-like familyprotein [Pseudomonas putida]
MLQRVRDLIAIPELRSRLLSGAQGLDHKVRWAHVCELPDPTEWLGEGDVLMTTGLGIPRVPAEQHTYVTRLAQAGIAGMMIGEHMQAPQDISALVEQAETLGFPVILTEYGVPFAAVTRAIIDANQQDEFARRGALAKVYESARLSIQGLGLPALLQRLQTDIQCCLYLVSLDTFTPWAHGLGSTPRNACMCTSRPWSIGYAVSKRSAAAPWTIPPTSPRSGLPCKALWLSAVHSDACCYSKQYPSRVRHQASDGRSGALAPTMSPWAMALASSLARSASRKTYAACKVAIFA